MCQYLPLYELSTNDYEMIVRSFMHVFPENMLFYTGDDTIMLGFRDKKQMDVAVLRSRMSNPAVRTMLSEMGITNPGHVLGLFVMGGMVPGVGKLNTDDHPYVEYSAPRSAMRYTNFDNRKLLLKVFANSSDELTADLDDTERSAVMSTRIALQTYLKGNALLAEGKREEGINLLRKAAAEVPHNPAITDALLMQLLEVAQQFHGNGKTDAAKAEFQEILSYQDQNFHALVGLANIALEEKNVPMMDQYLLKIEKNYSSSPLALALRAKYFIIKNGDYENALRCFERATKVAPRKKDIWVDYMNCAAKAGRLELAEQVREQVRALSR